MADSNKTIPNALGASNPDLAGRLFNQAQNILGKSLSLRLARHGMVTTNLSNKDTPGYRVRNIRFEKVMSDALGGLEGKVQMAHTSPAHLPVADIDRAYRKAQQNVQYGIYGQDADGQDVIDMDQEMTKLAKNQLLYNTTVQLLAKEFELLKYSITEGGR
jgi:flagellar basal-body rod protein FlgB